MIMASDLQQGASTGSVQSKDTAFTRAMRDQLGAARNGPPPAEPVRLARIAGLLYLVIAIFGGFAQMVRVNVYRPGNAAATASNLVANAALVRLSFVADLIQALVWLVMAVILYRLLAHAGRNSARALVVFVAVSVAIATLNLVHQFGALLVATDPSYAAALGTGAANSLALLLMDLQHYGYLIAQVTWLWLFVLGWLGYRSGMFPKWLSFLLMLGTVCYVVDGLTRFLAPSAASTSAAAFLVPEIICELALLAYLLIKGVRTRRPTPLAPVTP